MPFLQLDPTTAQAAPAWTVGAPLTSVGKTLSGMITELNARMGGRTDIDPLRMTEWINDAYIDLTSSLNLPDLESDLAISTAAGQPFYLLPDNVSYTTGADLADTTTYPWQGGTPLDKIDEDAYRRFPDRDDQPEAYFVKAGKLLVLWPTPTLVSTVVVQCVANPQLLVADTDSPIIDRSMHEGIVLLALAKAFNASLEWDNGQLAMNDYVAWMRRRKDRAAAEKTGMIARARGVRSLRDSHRIRRNREEY